MMTSTTSDKHIDDWGCSNGGNDWNRIKGPYTCDVNELSRDIKPVPDEPYEGVEWPW